MKVDRHRCEVRHILKLRTRSQSAALDYIELVSKRRSVEAAKKLQEDCANEWRLANRGDWGDWRSEVTASKDRPTKGSIVELAANGEGKKAHQQDSQKGADVEEAKTGKS